ncbi:universal stress protein [Halobacteriales archaeon QS_9_68_42]|nr:MAG: universal stress protein [Halobacteriales archaeon QS_9_68_42]
MYHVALGIPREDEHLENKLEAVAALPDAETSVRVSVVYVHDGEADVGSVPTIAEATDRLGSAGIEASVHNIVDEDPAAGLLEAAGELDPDAIYIGGRRRSPAGKLQLKPGAQEVLLRAEVPVIVAGDLESREPRT